MLRLSLVCLLITLGLALPTGDRSPAGDEPVVSNQHDECRRAAAAYAARTQAEWVALSRAHVDALVARKKDGLRSESSAGGFDQVIFRFFGVPDTMRREPVTRTRVFRHYVQEPEHLDAILATSRLHAGETPYMQVDESSSSTYVDMTGIFITNRKRPSQEVGLMRGQAYVDFTLPEGTGLVRLESGIYLIPGRAGAMQMPITIVGHSRGTGN